MRIAHIKTITILIAGAVFTAGLIMGFGGYVFAADPVPGLDITICQGICPDGRVSDKIYDSSLSKTKSIGLVRMEVGDVLLRYGVGGADINKVTEALEGKGVYEAELKRFLLAIGMNEKDAQDILLEFDKIGISKDGTQGLDAPTLEFTDSVAPSATGQSGAGQIEKGVSAPGTGDTPQPAIVHQELHRPPTSVAPLEQPSADEARMKGDFSRGHQPLRSVQSLRQDLRENAKELRDNFRENVRTTIGHVDHGKTARIAVAHGKGLRMINRYRSAMARFDHILGRLESRIEKIGIENEARAETGKYKDAFPPKSIILLIEEAKNTQALNKAKLAELEAKYESLLTGKNPGGVAEEARAIAKELKSEIEKLHGLLDDIKQAATDFNSSVSNTTNTL